MKDEGRQQQACLDSSFILPGEAIAMRTDLPDTPAAGHASSINSAVLSSRGGLTGRLAASMAWRWRQGERPLAEEYLARHPELLERPEEAFDLIYEELCLRQEQGEVQGVAALLARFPQWRQQLEMLLACHQLLEPARPPNFPEAGQDLDDFRLVA